MKISRIGKLSKHPITLSIMVMSIICSSFFALNAKAKSISTYSATDLFRAIYFLEGDIVNQVPTLGKLKSHLTNSSNQNSNQLISEIVNKVNEMDPGFINRLYNDVSSDDHFKISETLKEGGELVLLAGISLDEYSEGSMFPNLDSYDLSDPSQRDQAIGKIEENKDNYGNDPLYIFWPCLIIYYFIVVWISVEESPNNSALEAITQDNSISHEMLVDQLVLLN